MTYNLRNGYSVRTTRLPGGDTEFRTLNPEGETISTVVHTPHESRVLVYKILTGAR